EKITNLFKETIVKATRELSKKWCISVFKDNAGIIEFGKKWALAFKVETHNHPCAIEPYGGAQTGVGGVVRDVLGVGLGAKPVLNTDIFCFAPPGYRKNLPQNALTPERIMRGVVYGVKNYGNIMGIPTAGGAIWFDERYALNPLVFVGTLGVMPRWAVQKHVRPGDLIVAVGGRTGRDGIHGATFSSADIENADSSAVQIGHPTNEKKVLDAILIARDKKLYRGLTDCGAGGFSSAIGELGAECGARVYLERAKLKDTGISPWEIWISESQERMILAVPPQKLKELVKIFDAENSEITALGEFNNSGRLLVTHNGGEIVNLDMKFLHGACPKIEKRAVWKEPAPARNFKSRSRLTKENGALLKKVLANLNTCSREWVIRHYDHEVQGGLVIKPLQGVNSDGPGDACVIWPHAATGDTNDYFGFAVSHGINPDIGKINPYEMAIACADEAVRNLLCVGADISKCAFLDNFCWGNPSDEKLMGELVMCARGCYDGAKGYSAPFISGKDSFYNQSKNSRGENVSVPSTLLISAVAPVIDVRKTFTMDIKRPQSRLYLLGITKDDIGASVYRNILNIEDNSLSKTDIKKALASFTAVYRAMREGLILSAHDLSQGGMLACVAEMAFSGGIGAEIDLSKAIYEGKNKCDEMLAYSETQSRILLEVSPLCAAKFEKIMSGHTLSCVGETIKQERLIIKGRGGGIFINEDLDALKSAWKDALEAALKYD
ncbi:MAG: phosphoribosylformylglycinamidine synthase subunit PurL, partial [Elusimicrobia bacterium]|nr:phosphoribosylformylglycinamidine synthase subunit PurL [Elusimicrobiota bacterium]